MIPAGATAHLIHLHVVAFFFFTFVFLFFVFCLPPGLLLSARGSSQALQHLDKRRLGSILVSMHRSWITAVCFCYAFSTPRGRSSLQMIDGVGVGTALDFDQIDLGKGAGGLSGCRRGGSGDCHDTHGFR